MSDEPGALRFVDMHCHLDLMSNAPEVAEHTARLGIGMFCITVTPEGFQAAQLRLAKLTNVRIGVGMHPWWVSNESLFEQQAQLAVQLASSSSYVGEIGLDFSSAHADTREAQILTFEGILAACAEHPLPNRVLSIHAVQSASTVLDLLERYELPGHAACIFHWFSGTSEELARLRRLGCFVSVNEHMLKTKRGREYARQLPVNQLLLETDAPPQLNASYSASQLETSLDNALSTIANLRKVNKKELAAHITQTSSRLLGLW